jgi:hypothetical protein
MGFTAHGTETVRVTGVRLVDPPAAGGIAGVFAVKAEGAMIGGTHDIDKSLLRPVTEARFTPGKPQVWYFLVHFKPTRTGTHVTRAVDIDWRAGGRSGRTRFHYAVGVKVTETPAPAA